MYVELGVDRFAMCPDYFNPPPKQMVNGERIRGKVVHKRLGAQNNFPYIS